MKLTKHIVNARRIKRLRIDPSTIGKVFSLNTTLKIESNMPPTARMVHLYLDKKEACIWVFYQCQDWDLVKEGEYVPELPWDTTMIFDEGNE